MQEIKERAKELLASGQVQRVLGWKRGEDLPYNPQPAFFENEAQLEELVYDSFNFRPLNFICKDPDADVMKDRLRMVAGQLTDALKQEKTVVLENREQGRISVKLRDVTYIESNSHSIIYHFANNKDTIAVRDSISEIEEAYRKFDFIRVHKKYIVNLKYVFNISRSNETVIFKSGSELPMSRGYKNAVDDALTEYLRRK